MFPTLSQVCTLSAPLERDFKDYAAAGCESIELWWTKLEAYLEAHSESDFQTLRQRHRLATPVASYQGGLLDSQGARRKEAWQLWTQRLELAARLEIGTLIVACDVAPPLDQSTVERTKVSLRQLAESAASVGLRVALEFQVNSALGNNLQTAVALVEEVGLSCLGICLDAFHFFVGPSKLSDLGLLTAENLSHVQLCDLVDVPRELARDADRILPGDGTFELAAIVQRLVEIGYDRAVSIELMNPQIWQVPPLQFAETGMSALRTMLDTSLSSTFDNQKSTIENHQS